MTPEPLELAYSAPGAQGRPESVTGSVQGQNKPSARTGMDSAFVRSLPEWAQRFLREGAPQTRDEAVRQIGTARDISALALFEREESVEWTAPQYPVPAPVTFRERPEQPGRQAQPQAQDVRISDAELRRVSDRVYQIVEDRIRLERRRLGL